MATIEGWGLGSIWWFQHYERLKFYRLILISQFQSVNTEGDNDNGYAFTTTYISCNIRMSDYKHKYANIANHV